MFSIVVPAHNEQELLPRCLDAIDLAVQRLGRTGTQPPSRVAEVIVVANRCTDRTVAIAVAHGATVVEDASRCIAAVRNAGAVVATGEVLVTIDADSLMSADALVEIERHLATGRYVGGGCAFVPERTSLGIRTTLAVTRIAVALTRLGGVMYWCSMSDFRAIGGFDENRTIAEDLNFARRLRAHGRRTHRRFTNLPNAAVITSCRKFDRFGDWHMFGMIRQSRSILASMRGTDTRFVDTYFHDFNA
jgi:glycosyltransferase involved in cell wall biosynthesis